jgi:hypothetical protein
MQPSKRHIELPQPDKRGIRVAAHPIKVPPQPPLRREVQKAVLAARLLPETGPS